MRARRHLVIPLVLTLLPGCEWVRNAWPWGQDEDVPVTQPREDPNAGEPIGPVAVATRPAVVPHRPGPRPEAPRPTGPAVARADGPEPIRRPTNLTDLLYGPAKSPAPTVAPPPVSPAPTPSVVSPAPSPAIVPLPVTPTPAPSPVTVQPPVPPTPAPAPAKPPSAGERPVVPAPAVPPASRPAVAANHGRPDMPAGPAAKPPPGAAVAIGKTVLPPGVTPKPTGPEQVVAASAIQVNRRFITVTDIVRRLRLRMAEMPPTISPDAFRQRVAPWIAQEVEARILRMLVLEEADKHLTDQQKKQVDVEVQQAHNALLADAGGSKTALKQQLARDGTTLEEVLTEHRERAAHQLFLHSRFRPNIVITRKKLWNYYRRHGEEFSSEKKVQMQLIAAPFGKFLPEGVTRPSAAEQSAARKQAKAVIDQADTALKGGEDFADVAKRLSRGAKASSGGTWPPMEAGTFKQTKVEEAAFQLAEGQVAGPIETDDGYYIVKTARIVGGEVIPFEDAQEQIADTLRNRISADLTQKYFTDLQAKSLIVRSKKFAELALRKAAEVHFRPK